MKRHHTYILFLYVGFIKTRNFFVFSAIQNHVTHSSVMRIQQIQPGRNRKNKYRAHWKVHIPPQWTQVLFPQQYRPSLLRVKTNLKEDRSFLVLSRSCVWFLRLPCKQLFWCTFRSGCRDNSTNQKSFPSCHRCLWELKHRQDHGLVYDKNHHIDKLYNRKQ